MHERWGSPCAQECMRLHAIAIARLQVTRHVIRRDSRWVPVTRSRKDVTPMAEIGHSHDVATGYTDQRLQIRCWCCDFIVIVTAQHQSAPEHTGHRSTHRREPRPTQSAQKSKESVQPTRDKCSSMQNRRSTTKSDSKPPRTSTGQRLEVRLLRERYQRAEMTPGWRI